jgi:FixJ family two-component response regulator
MLLTGHADIDAVIDAINKGQIYKYIAKPWNESELRDLVKEASALYHDRQAIVLRGEDLQQRMSKAEQEAVKIQALTSSQTALTADETARVFELANAIQRLLQA